MTQVGSILKSDSESLSELDQRAFYFKGIAEDHRFDCLRQVRGKNWQPANSKSELWKIQSEIAKRLVDRFWFCKKNLELFTRVYQIFHFERIQGHPF